MNRLALVAAGALGIVAAMRLFARRGPSVAPFVPDPANDKTIAVRGLSRVELDQVLQTFWSSYEPTEVVEVRVAPLAFDQTRLTFPDDILPDLYFALVNYLTYPTDVDDITRIGVLGRTTLNAQFDLFEATLAGQMASVYVPSDDSEYDVVYVRVASGLTFESSFGRHWRLAETPRMPASIQGL